MLRIEECKDRYFYRIAGRNLGFGVYSENNKAFVGIRRKFDHEYLDTEYHWDTGTPFGTVVPLFEIKVCPIKNSEESEVLFGWIAQESGFWFTELFAHVESLKEAMILGKNVYCNKSTSLKNTTPIIRKVKSFSDPYDGFGKRAFFDDGGFVEISDCHKDNFYIGE